MRETRFQEQKAVELCRQGRVSTDKAAQIANVTVVEMMSLLARAGIRSEESFAEYREGLKLLLNE